VIDDNELNIKLIKGRCKKRPECVILEAATAQDGTKKVKLKWTLYLLNGMKMKSVRHSLIV
jgi:hypothetical protein